MSLSYGSSTLRTSVGVLAVAVALTLTACGGGSSAPSGKASRSQSTAAPKVRVVVPNVAKSCQIVIASGAIEDVAKVFDKYKGGSGPLDPADAKEMRTALDRLAKAGDNASPKIRESVVELVADAGSFIDSRAQLEGVGKVASVSTIQKELDSLCK